MGYRSLDAKAKELEWDLTGHRDREFTLQIASATSAHHRIPAVHLLGRRHLALHLDLHTARHLRTIRGRRRIGQNRQQCEKSEGVYQSLSLHGLLYVLVGRVSIPVYSILNELKVPLDSPQTSQFPSAILTSALTLIPSHLPLNRPDVLEATKDPVGAKLAAERELEIAETRDVV